MFARLGSIYVKGVAVVGVIVGIPAMVFDQMIRTEFPAENERGISSIDSSAYARTVLTWPISLAVAGIRHFNGVERSVEIENITYSYTPGNIKWLFVGGFQKYAVGKHPYFYEHIGLLKKKTT